MINMTGTLKSCLLVLLFSNCAWTQQRKRGRRLCVEEWASGDTDIIFNFPQAKTLTSVKLDNTRNEQECIPNHTYGYDEHLVWVHVPCQAEVTVCMELSTKPIPAWERSPTFGLQQAPSGPPPAPPTCIEEWVSGSSEMEFVFPKAKSIVSVEIETQQSVTNRCIPGTSYGFNTNKVWLREGCIGKANICFVLEETAPAEANPTVETPTQGVLETHSKSHVSPAVSVNPSENHAQPVARQIMGQNVGVQNPLLSLMANARPVQPVLGHNAAPGSMQPAVGQTIGVHSSHPAVISNQAVHDHLSAAIANAGQLLGQAAGQMPLHPMVGQPGQQPTNPLLGQADLLGVLANLYPQPEPECIDNWSSGKSRTVFSHSEGKDIVNIDVTNIDVPGTCIMGRDIHVDGHAVMVDIGCQAEFEICYSYYR